MGGGGVKNNQILRYVIRCLKHKMTNEIHWKSEKKFQLKHYFEEMTQNFLIFFYILIFLLAGPFDEYLRPLCQVAALFSFYSLKADSYLIKNVVYICIPC